MCTLWHIQIHHIDSKPLKHHFLSLSLQPLFKDLVKPKSAHILRNNLLVLWSKSSSESSKEHRLGVFLRGNKVLITHTAKPSGLPGYGAQAESRCVPLFWAKECLSVPHVRAWGRKITSIKATGLQWVLTLPNTHTLSTWKQRQEDQIQSQPGLWLFFSQKKKKLRGWRNGSAAKNIYCFSREPNRSSQHSHHAGLNSL